MSLEYQLRKSRGTCVSCGNRAATGRVQCVPCGKRYLEKCKQRQAKLIAEGVCIRCLKLRDRPHGRLCAECLKFRRDDHKQRREKLIASGCCCRCGVVLENNNNVRCIACYLKMMGACSAGGARFWKDLKDLYEKQNGRCPYTGRQLTLGLDTELDHVVPKSQGGTCSINNVQWVYAPINQMKRDHLHDRFLELVSEIYLHSVKQ